MKNKKYFLWINLGTIVAFLAGLFTIMVYHAITWAPVLVEIASVTWNDSPIS